MLPGFGAPEAKAFLPIFASEAAKARISIGSPGMTVQLNVKHSTAHKQVA